jgi:hypothetical protein
MFSAVLAWHTPSSRDPVRFQWLTAIVTVRSGLPGDRLSRLAGDLEAPLYFVFDMPLSQIRCICHDFTLLSIVQKLPIVVEKTHLTSCLEPAGLVEDQTDARLRARAIPRPRRGTEVVPGSAVLRHTLAVHERCDVAVAPATVEQTIEPVRLEPVL